MRIYNRNPNLTDEQKKEIKDTLNRYSYLEGTVDWNKSDKFTYEDFKSMILDKVKTSKTSQKKQKRSMAGLTEGKDYLCLYDGEGKMKGGGREVMYVPLTWKASMILGSNHVEPKTWPDSKLMPAKDFVGGDVKVEGNAMEMGAVGLQCFFSKAAGGGVSQKDVKCFFKGDFFCCGTCCGHLNSCHVSVLLILQIPAKNQEVTRLLKTRKNPWKRLVSKDLVETTGLEPVTSCV